MSSSTTPDTSDSLVSPPSEQFQRLTVEAGKFLGKDAGESIPMEAVRRQAAANGYTDSEIDELLKAGGCFDAERVTIPEQGDLLGELWSQPRDDVGDAPKSTAEPAFEERPTSCEEGCQPEPLDESVVDCYRLREPIATSAESVDKERYLIDGEPMTAFNAAESYIKKRHGENVSARKHGFKKTLQWRARRRYAKGKDTDRQLLKEYDNPTTALLSLRISPGDRGRLTLLAGMKEAIDETLNQLGYRLQRGPNAPFSSGEWEYFAVIAGTDGRATPHLHIMVYCDGDVRRKRFEPVVEKFVEKCPYAPDDMTGNEVDEGTIRVHGQGRDEIPRMDDTPAESAGATYVLAQLPHFEDVDNMARDALLHSSTVDAWQGRAFRKSTHTVWDDDGDPSAEEVSGVNPTSSVDSLSDLL